MLGAYRYDGCSNFGKNTAEVKAMIPELKQSLYEDRSKQRGLTILETRRMSPDRSLQNYQCGVMILIKKYFEVKEDIYY